MSVKSSKGSNLKISESVLESISKTAALEIEGVESLANINQGIKGFITKKYLEKPISIDLVDGVASITISVNVKYGHAVGTIATNIQENIKNSIQNMTSVAVSKTNVLISNVVFNEKQNDDKN